MRTWRSSDLDPMVAERLLSGVPSDVAPVDVSTLLAALRTAPLPVELAGERRAVLAYRRVFRTGPATAPHRPRWATRGAAVKLTAAAVVLAAGGTVAAAQTGATPASLTDRVHDLLRTTASPDVKAGGGAAGTARAGATSPGAGPTSPAALSPAPTLLELCRQWRQAQRDKRRPMSAAALRELTAAAGGEDRIDAVCGALDTSSPAPHTPSTSPEPSNGPSTTGRRTAPHAGISVRPSGGTTGRRGQGAPAG